MTTMNKTARIATLSNGRSAEYTYSEEIYNELWIVRDSRGIEIARCGNVRDASRVADALNEVESQRGRM